MFDVQESGTFQLTFDLRNELGNGELASREIFLNGNYHLKLSGASISTGQIGVGVTAAAPSLNLAGCLQVTSPQIRSSLTPSAPGFVVPMSPEPLIQTVETYPGPIPGGSTVRQYLNYNSIVGDVMKHSLLATLQNKLEIQVRVSNTNAVFNTVWNTFFPSAFPSFLILTFEYVRTI